MQLSQLSDTLPCWLSHALEGSLPSLDVPWRCAAPFRGEGGFGSRAGSSAKPGEGKGEGPKVLVVDDNAINRRVLAGMVRALGCEVEMAGDGSEAIEQIQKDQSFQLVFMDCEMPGMDGFEATRQIRRRWGSSVPIVAASAYTSDDDQQRCIECGMNDFMSKPLKRPAVRGVLEKWIPGVFGRGAA